MIIERIAMENKEFRGHVNFALICKDEKELYSMCGLLNNYLNDFPEDADNGRVSMVFMFDSDEISNFKEEYKICKKIYKEAVKLSKLAYAPTFERCLEVAEKKVS